MLMQLTIKVTFLKARHLKIYGICILKLQVLQQKLMGKRIAKIENVRQICNILFLSTLIVKKDKNFY